MKKPCVISLHNIITIDRRALGHRLGQLNQRQMSAVCAAVAFAIGCDQPLTEPTTEDWGQ